VKPLAAIFGQIPKNPDLEELPEYLFDPYVRRGIFEKLDYCEPNRYKSGPILVMHVLLYALKHEAWRIDAYILLRSTANKMGWSDELTRFEGALLGYMEWENDAYLEQLRSAKAGKQS
jgi:hypothetical protein